MDVFFRRLYDHSIRVGFEDTEVWLKSKNSTFSIKPFYSSLANSRVEHFSHDVVWNS